MTNGFDLRRLVLLLTGIIFGGFGLLCLLYPELPTTMTGIDLATQTAQIEAQAVYGGLQLGLGVLLLCCAFVPKWSVMGAWIVVAQVGGLALARGAGVANHGWDSIYTTLALLYESSTALTALLTIFVNPPLRRKPPEPAFSVTPIGAPAAPQTVSDPYSPLP
ncbi:MAG: hypothetical protein AMXMBFR76_05060 [Pseudomonadota bacterium]|jgi:hypothetical protein